MQEDLAKLSASEVDKEIQHKTSKELLEDKEFMLKLSKDLNGNREILFFDVSN